MPLAEAVAEVAPPETNKLETFPEAGMEETAVAMAGGMAVEMGVEMAVETTFPMAEMMVAMEKTVAMTIRAQPH